MKTISKHLSIAIFLIALYSIEEGTAQSLGVNTNAPDASAVMDVTATDKGLLIPRVSLIDVSNTTAPINSPAEGLVVYNTNATVIGGNGKGFYFFNGTSWMQLNSGDQQDLSLSVNTLSLTNDVTTVDLSGYLDNTDNQSLNFSGSDLSISGGNTVSLSSLTNSDNQDLSLSGNTLSLTNDATTVDLSPFLNNFFTENGTSLYDSRGSSTAGSNNALAIGRQNTASGAFSTAVGYQNNASKTGASALGNQNTATEEASSAVGYENQAFEDGASAFGSRNIASGRNSSAFGTLSYASGQESHAFGYQTSALGFRETVVGTNNDTAGYSPSATTWVNTDRIFTVGIGEAFFNQKNAMTILKNGNIGVGTNTPDANLEVVGSFQFDDGNQQVGYILSSDASGNAEWKDPSNLFPAGDDLGNHTAGQTIQLNDNWISNDGDNEGIRITNDGAVGIGDDLPFQHMEIRAENGWSLAGDATGVDNLYLEDLSESDAQDAIGGSISFSGAGNGASGTPARRHAAIAAVQTDSDNDQVGLVFFTHNSTSSVADMQESMRINHDGRVGINVKDPFYLLGVNGTAAKPGGGFWIAGSDRRLKQDIKPYREGLDQILAIKPVTYRYNDLSGHDTEIEYVGVIAQELQEVAPYMVGNFDKDGETYLDVDASAMIYMLINSVKELNQKLREKDNKLEQQTQLIEDLARRLETIEQKETLNVHKH